MSSADRTYGTSSGLSITESSFPYVGAGSGESIKHIVFAEGDPDTAQADPNTPTTLSNPLNAETQFGAGSRLAEALQIAGRNGTDRTQLRGVMPETVAVTGEAIAGGTGQLQNFPIIADTTRITVTDTTDDTPVDVTLAYGADITGQASADTVAINPYTGAVDDGSADGAGGDYTVEYPYSDWEAALDAADGVVNEDEAAVYHVEVCSSTVAELLRDKIDGPDAETDGLRQHVRLIYGLVGAEPNATGPNGEPWLDTESYTRPVSSDAIFTPGPVLRASGRTILGGIGGKMAGNAIGDPIIGRDESIEGYDGDGPVQALTYGDAEPLRDAGVMPVEQGTDSDGSPSLYLEDNISTYEYASGTPNDPDSLPVWTRDYLRRRIVDQVIAVTHDAQRVGENRLLSSSDQTQTMELVKSAVATEIEDMIARGLLEGPASVAATGAAGGQGASGTGTQDEVRTQTGENGAYYLEVSKIGVDTLGITERVAPTGIVKASQARISIARTVSDIQDASTGTETGTPAN